MLELKKFFSDPHGRTGECAPYMPPRAVSRTVAPNLCRSLAIEREFGCLALFVGLKFFATSRRVELSVVGCCRVRSRHEGTRASNLLRGFSGPAPVRFYSCTLTRL